MARYLGWKNLVAIAPVLCSREQETDPGVHVRIIAGYSGRPRIAKSHRLYAGRDQTPMTIAISHSYVQVVSASTDPIHPGEYV